MIANRGTSSSPPIPRCSSLFQPSFQPILRRCQSGARRSSGKVTETGRWLANELLSCPTSGLPVPAQAT